MTRPSTIVGALIDQAVAVSRSIALFLAKAETILEHGTELSGVQALNPRTISAEEFLAAIGEECRSGFGETLKQQLGWQWSGDDRPLEMLADEQVLRLARLVLLAWVAEGGRGARRPDVLALTCQILANPAAPHTLDLVRFSVVLALRAAYQIPYSVESIQKLREAYGGLRLRKQSKRQRRTATQYESLIIDLLSMDGWIQRSLTKRSVKAYYQEFLNHPLGVDPGVDPHERGRDFGASDGPQLDGTLPEFARLLNLAFNQPVGIPGLDEITDA